MKSLKTVFMTCPLITDDNKVWMGEYSTELKLFDPLGHLHHTVSTFCIGMYLRMYNQQVV